MAVRWSRCALASRRWLTLPATSAISPLHAPDAAVLHKALSKPELLKPYLDRKLQVANAFDTDRLVSVAEMFRARVHYGHKVGTVHAKMKWALYGERLGVCIFDLDIAQVWMRRALDFLAHMAHRGALVLFVCTNRANMLMVERMATEMGEYAHIRKWEHGTLLNSARVFGSPVRLPDVIVLLNTPTSLLDSHPAILEAAKMAIPTVAIVDSNADPSYVTYPIPGNDDSPASVQLYMQLFRHAIERGKQARREASPNG